MIPITPQDVVYGVAQAFDSPPEFVFDAGAKRARLRRAIAQRLLVDEAGMSVHEARRFLCCSDARSTRQFPPTEDAAFFLHFAVAHRFARLRAQRRERLIEEILAS